MKHSPMRTFHSDISKKEFPISSKGQELTWHLKD